MPLYTEQVKDYFAAKAPRYDDVVHQAYWRLSDELLWSRLSEEVLPRVGATARLLDAGGGTGRWTERFLTAVPHGSAVVFDLSPDMRAVAEARAQLPGLAGRMAVQAGDVHRLRDSHDGGSFDVVFCFHNVLGFVADPAAVVRQLSEVLRPGGVLAMVVPNIHHMAYFSFLRGAVGEAEELLETGKGRFTPDMPAIRAFAPEQVEELAGLAGLTVDLLTGFPCALYPGYQETQLHGSTQGLSDLLEDEERFAAVFRVERRLMSAPRVAARGNNLLLVATR